MRGILRRSAVRRAAGADRVARVHRTTTAATLLVTVAVSALTGCVTVHRPTAPGPPTAPSQPPVRPEGRTHTQIVQAPAREALEMIAVSRPGEAPASPSHRSTPAPAPTERTAPSGDRDRPARRAPERTEASRRPPVELSEVPDVILPDVRSTTDVCALGRRYGGWRPDSPEARICRKAYGR